MVVGECCKMITISTHDIFPPVSTREKVLLSLACGKGFISDDGLLHNQQLPSTLPFQEKGESF